MLEYSDLDSSGSIHSGTSENDLLFQSAEMHPGVILGQNILLDCIQNSNKKVTQVIFLFFVR